MMTDLSSYVEKQTARIEQQLEKLISSHHGPHQKLFEAARYAVLGTGKRLRPLLTLATTEMFGIDSSIVLPIACTLELIHNYSLIHDDLPCMDDDDFRRGKFTVHRKYSEGLAVLTGDFLLTYAFEVITNDKHLNAEKKVQLISTLAKRAGSEGMIGGQVMDLTYEKQNPSLEMLQLLHRYKTASLLTAALEFGGIIGNASFAELQVLRQFGECFGLAFQVVDDILDFTSPQSKHGRSISSDLLNEKSTYVSLMGLERAHLHAEHHAHQAMNCLKQLPYDYSTLSHLVEISIHRKQ